MKFAIIMAMALAMLPARDRAEAVENQTNDPGTREPAVAGRFYPGAGAKLENSIRSYLKKAVKPLGAPPVAIVAPHAGYIFSGQIAADAFNQAAGGDYDIIVLLGTNHTTHGFRKVSVYPGEGYKTPLGLAEIDRELAKKLINEEDAATFEKPVHRNEHSVEVMVPFVQTLFPGTKILPAVVGNPDLCERFGNALAGVLKDRRPLIVASSDLSHYPNYDDAVETDGKILDAMLKMDPKGFHAAAAKLMNRNVKNLSTCACGEAPIMAAMAAARKLGANCGKIVSYANSGDAPVGDRSRVVGYGAVVFSKETPCPKNDEIKKSGKTEGGNALERHHKKALLGFARETIAQYLASETAPIARGFDPVLRNKRGAFVTIKKHGNLRGCIGHMAEDTPLCQVVGAMALRAAFADRRFSPLAKDEYPDIEIEISALTPFRKVGGADDIVVGRDGVVIEKDGRSAVFLPQVAPEQGWTRDEMLEHLCLKARLPKNAWKKDAAFYTFQADVFGEGD